MAKNPFGDDVGPPRRGSPFDDEPDIDTAEGAAVRLEHAARKVRQLRTQLGAEGLTLSATRELISELGAAFDAAAKGFRARSR